MASISTHFSKYRATALGIVAAGSSLGGVVFPIIMRHLFDVIGFGWTLRVMGLISAVGCSVAVVAVSSNKPPVPTPGPWINFKMFREPCFALLSAGSFFIALGLFIPIFFIVECVRHNGVSASLSAYVLSIMNVGGIFGRIAPAVLSDTLGRFNILAPSAFLSGVSCLIFWQFSRSLLAFMLFAATYGFFSGAFISVITPCVAQISPIEEIGTRIGMLYSIVSVPSLLGGPIAGALLAVGKNSYTGMISFSGSTIVAGSLLIFWAKLKINPLPFARV
jgi:predicted MFS family arabinose efflux permease